MLILHSCSTEVNGGCSTAVVPGFFLSQFHYGSDQTGQLDQSQRGMGHLCTQPHLAGSPEPPHKGNGADFKKYSESLIFPLEQSGTTVPAAFGLGSNPALMAPI